VLVITAVIGVLVLFFFSGIVKWIFLVLVVFAAAGAGIKDGLRGVCWLVLVSSALFSILWFLESPEYRAGLAAYDKGNFATAIEHLNLEIETHPKKSSAYLIRCQARLKSEQLQEALSDCNRAINLGSERKEESHSARARVHRKLGMAEQAVDDFNAALRYVSWDSSVSKWYLLYERGLMNQKLGRSDEAIHDLEETIHLREDWYAAWWPLGNSYFNKGDFKQALAAYERYQKSYDPKVDPFPEALKKRMAHLRKSIN
jgi:tetratricopeptide (TPR) repeat protein